MNVFISFFKTNHLWMFSLTFSFGSLKNVLEDNILYKKEIKKVFTCFCFSSG